MSDPHYVNFTLEEVKQRIDDLDDDDDDANYNEIVELEAHKQSLRLKRHRAKTSCGAHTKTAFCSSLNRMPSKATKARREKAERAKDHKDRRAKIVRQLDGGMSHLVWDRDDGACLGTYDDDGYFHPEVHDWEECDLEWPCDECCKLGQCHTKAGDSFQPTPAAHGAPIWDLPCPHCAK